jgi:hypothetical protein
MALDPRSCMYRCDQPERCGALVPPLKDRASSARHSTCSLQCGPEIAMWRRSGGGGHIRAFYGFYGFLT